jgi:hypothetical protein
MGKYEPLARYLKTCPEDSWNATFAQVEEKLGFALPRSAREHRAWWSNQRDGNHSQTAGWQAAGWETRDVDLRRGIVRFERAGGRGRQNPSTSQSPPSGQPAGAPGPDLWRQASDLSGIEDREKLVEAALAALIRQETARYFARIGGSMPDFEAPPRERPFA